MHRKGKRTLENLQNRTIDMPQCLWILRTGDRNLKEPDL